MNLTVVAAFVFTASACLATACSASDTSSTSVDPTAPTGTAAAAPTTPSVSEGPPKKPDGGEVTGGPVCRTRCEKAGCADLDACVELCERQAASIPASCESAVQAVDACIDAGGTWKCVRGEAKASGPCVKEALALLTCMLGGGPDAGAADASGDAAADGGF